MEISAKNVPKHLVKRLQSEMNQFDDKDYNSEFSLVSHIDDHTVSVTLKNGKTYVITRDFDFITSPPSVYDETEQKFLACASDYSPAFMSVKWFLMTVYI